MKKEKAENFQNNSESNVKEDLPIVDKNVSKQGIHNFISIIVVEILYLFFVEIGFRIIFGSSLLDWAVVRILVSSLAVGGLLAFITNPMKPIIRKIILILFNFLVVLYSWLQLCFMDFLGSFISMGSAEQGTKITDYIGDFLVSVSPKNYFLFILFVLFILYIIFEKKITRAKYNKKLIFSSFNTYICALLYAFVVIFLFMLTLDLNFMQNKYQTISNKELFKNTTNPALAIKNFGTTTYFLLDLKSTLFGLEENIDIISPNETKEIEKIETNYSRHIDDTVWDMVIEEEKDSNFIKLNQYFKNREITDKNEYTGIFEGKNLIVVMMESVGSAVFDKKYSEYFPTLHKLYNEGITAVNHYSPRNNCATGESELTTATSLYSIETTCTVNTYKNNVYPEALLSMFKTNDYYTSAYHDYTDQYYNRSYYEKNFGAIDFYNVKGLNMSYNPVYVEWPSDVVFVEKALPKFINKERFASFMVTVTAHSPYMYSSEQGNKYISLFKDLNVDTTTKRYLSKIKVVDLAIEKMLEELTKANKLDDTVIVLYGDHYPYALSNKEYNSLTEIDITVNQEMDRTPLIIYNSAVESKAITKYATQLDIAPTILNMFGIDYDPRFYLGHDLLSEYDDYAIFPDNSWYAQIGFYNASKGIFIPKDSTVDAEFYDEYIIKMNGRVAELRNMSALAIKKDYFKNLFKKINAKKEELEREQELQSTKGSEE